jgi:large subunit ribosomal protein L29
MKRREWKELAAEELWHKETELRDEIFRLKMKRAASSLDNKMAIRNRRRDLARVITMLRLKTPKAEGKAH